MTRAFVIMTALPPTKGHLRLIEYAAALADKVEVHLNTQPGEPFVQDRYYALMDACQHLMNVSVHMMHKTLPQEPTEEDEAEFWDMWAGFLTEWGIQPGDYIVASERYGIKLAEITGAIFMPYDMERVLTDTKATRVRENTLLNFQDILPEFQPFLRKTVTIFGAESTGKTSLSSYLAKVTNSRWLPEWARPYLETVGPEITHQKMTNIWQGQLALQDHAEDLAVDSPFIIQDTDLYSTLGYWEFNSWQIEGEVPEKLTKDAHLRKSDLYIITPSEGVPFEADQLRYGGDHREINDQWWLDFAWEHGLNAVILPPNLSTFERAIESYELLNRLFGTPLDYKREGKEYQK